MKALAKAVYSRLPLKRQIFEIVRPFGLPQRLYQHLHFSGPFKVNLPDGSFRMLSHGDQIENELFWAGFGRAWEKTSLEVWRRLAKAASNGDILDIGANTGIYALTARAVNPVSPITAFEPVRRVADRTKANILLNKFDISVLVKAVSDQTGSAIIHDSNGANVYSASIETAFPGCDTSYEVPTVALDDLCESRKVSLIKLDVEMHEPAAIRGMLKMLRRDKPSLLVEVLTAEIGREISELLEGMDYRFFQIDEMAGLIERRSLCPLDGHNWNNLVCSNQQFEQAELKELCVRA